MCKFFISFSDMIVSFLVSSAKITSLFHWRIILWLFFLSLLFLGGSYKWNPPLYHSARRVGRIVAEYLLEVFSWMTSRWVVHQVDEEMGKSLSYRIHSVYQVLIGCHFVVLHMSGGDGLEKFDDIQPSGAMADL